MFNHFGNRPFLRYQAQGFSSFPLLNDYQEEEEDFKKRVKVIAIANVPVNANVISSHVLYKLKINDEKMLKLKAGISPHGNEDSLKGELKSDCAMCSPMGFRILLSISALFRCRITMADAKTAFLQTGDAARDVYVIPPTESKERGTCMWLLLAAAYGLVNSNAKWQIQSDQTLKDIGFEQVSLIPQLFFLKKKAN